MGDTQEANKQLVRGLYSTLMARGDTASADEILAEEYVDHNIPPPPAIRATGRGRS